MITQTKQQYTPPQCEELEIKLEGVIAVSQTDLTVNDPFSNQEEQTW